MNLDRFEAAARAAFAFLERDLDFTFEPDTSKERRDHWWVRYLTYRGERAFVRVELDSRDRAFNVLFGPLRDGEIPPYPIFMESEQQPILWFPLWAVLQVEDTDQPPFTFAEDGPLDEELRAWADALRKHAASALSGDASDLEEGVRRVMHRELAAADERDANLLERRTDSGDG